MAETPAVLAETPAGISEIMEALTDLLRVVRFSGNLFLEARFREPWCVRSQVFPEHCGPNFKAGGGLVSFHYVLEGTLQLNVGKEPARRAGPGDVIVLARNDAHLLGSDITLPAVQSTSLVRKAAENQLATIDHGGDGPVSHHFVCGFLSTPMRDHPLLMALPRLMVVGLHGRPCAEWAESSFRYAAQEHAARRPGSPEIVDRLAELLFVEAVREYIERLSGEATGWLAALRDPSLARALSALHTRPKHPWTAEGLAGEACLSRSAFAERFTSTVGVPPMSYLTRWRMLLAGQRLRESTETIAQIAETVGYESESTFSRAFAREMGIAPGAWRAANA